MIPRRTCLNKRMCYGLVFHVVAAVDAQAAVCKNVTPTHSDVVNDQMYVKSKCKALVSHINRNRLSSEAKALHQALATATSDYATLKIGTGKIEDKYETISSNRKVFDITKKAVKAEKILFKQAFRLLFRPKSLARSSVERKGGKE